MLWKVSNIQLIKYVSGNILGADTEALVNPVNTVGVMGKGLALQFKKAFPDNYRFYKRACDKNEVLIGRMFVYQRNSLINPRYIISFPTKKHWKEKSEISYVQDGLRYLVNVICENIIKSIALPALGCGLGGLEWENVQKIINESLSGWSDVDILIFEPGNEK